MLYSIHLQLNPGPARAGQYSTPNLAAMFHEVPLQQVFYPLPRKELIKFQKKEKNSLLVNCTIQCFKISPDRGHKMANYEYNLVQDLETNSNWVRTDTAISPENVIPR